MDKDDRRLLLQLLYEGPFEILTDALHSIDPVSGEIIREVPEGSLRARLAGRCEALDHAWREYYATLGRYPARPWLRRQPRQAVTS